MAQAFGCRGALNWGTLPTAFGERWDAWGCTTIAAKLVKFCGALSWGTLATPFAALVAKLIELCGFCS